MPTETTYTRLREELSSTLDRVADDQEIVVVRRRGAHPEGSRDVALIPASELTGLLETAHLLRSPANATRLLTALRRAERGNAKAGSVTDLRKELKLGESS